MGNPGGHDVNKKFSQREDGDSREPTEVTERQGSVPRHWLCRRSQAPRSVVPPAAGKGKAMGPPPERPEGTRPADP